MLGGCGIVMWQSLVVVGSYPLLAWYPAQVMGLTLGNAPSTDQPASACFWWPAYPAPKGQFIEHLAILTLFPRL